MKKTGIELVAQERKEQIEKHGFDLKHDLEYKGGQLKMAATYLLTGLNLTWPSSWSEKWKEKFSKKSEIDKLIVAAALVVADIDRLLASNKKDKDKLEKTEDE